MPLQLVHLNRTLSLLKTILNHLYKDYDISYTPYCQESDHITFRNGIEPKNFVGAGLKNLTFASRVLNGLLCTDDYFL